MHKRRKDAQKTEGCTKPVPQTKGTCARVPIGGIHKNSTLGSCQPSKCAPSVICSRLEAFTHSLSALLIASIICSQPEPFTRSLSQLR
eukprot:scaffold291500_cov14-Tisochrysis_lutea.AAC.1